MLKHTLTAAAFVAILASPAFAQTNRPQSVVQPDATKNISDVHKPSFVQNQHATDWRGSKLIGSIVYGPDNASIGSINDVLISNDSKVLAVVIGVGGFLGVGEKNVAVPLDTLNITRKPDSSAIDKVSVSSTKEELKNAPSFAFDEGAKAATTGSSVTDTMKKLNPLSEPKK